MGRPRYNHPGIDYRPNEEVIRREIRYLERAAVRFCPRCGADDVFQEVEFHRYQGDVPTWCHCNKCDYAWKGGWWQPILPASDIDIKNFANPFPPPPPPAAPVPAPDPVPIGDKKGESWDGSWILQMGGFVLFVAILVFLVMTFGEPEDGWGSDDEECRVEDRGGRIRETCW